MTSWSVAGWVAPTGLSFTHVLSESSPDIALACRVVVDSLLAVAIYDAAGRLLDANGPFLEFVGTSLGELIGREHGEIIGVGSDHGDHGSDGARPANESSWAGRISTEAVAARRRWTIRGRDCWVDVSYQATVDDDGRVLVVSASRDVTSVVHLEQRSQRMAQTDALTGLANRTAGIAALTSAMAAAVGRPGAVPAAIVIGLDRFNWVNAEVGYPLGDALLQTAAERLDLARPTSSYLARLGGDEFLVVLDGVTGGGDALGVATELLGHLCGTAVVGGRVVRLDASAGIAVWSPSTWAVGDILREADFALRKAKTSERGTAVLFDPLLRSRMTADRRIASELDRAITRQTIEVHYQPIVELRSGAVVGLEALARMREKSGAWIPPASFVAVAERSDLVMRLDMCVLNRALADLVVLLEEQPGLSMAVNFSRRHLNDAGFDERVLACLDRWSISPSHLTVEITETMALVDNERAERVLGRLRSVGVRVAIDDFGSGYASIGTLKHLPVDTVKIDRSFVEHLSEASNRRVLELMIGTAHQLGLQVVVEGLETDELIDAVRTAGGQLGQGFALARPTAVDSICFSRLVGPS